MAEVSAFVEIRTQDPSGTDICDSKNDIHNFIYWICKKVLNTIIFRIGKILARPTPTFDCSVLQVVLLYSYVIAYIPQGVEDVI